MKIFVSAAEISSDLQAEKIIQALVALYPAGTVTVAGIGGPRLRMIPNFQTIEHAENLRAMGFTEILGKLFKIKSILNRTLTFLSSFQPDLIITFDYPDFHFSLLKRCAENPALRNSLKICGIPPKIWVWRSKRIERIRALYDAVWVLFPFEKKLYEDAGIPVIFEGNPLIAESLKFAPSEKPEWNFANEIRIAVMPGSRDAEIKQHLKVIPETMELLAERSQKKIQVEIPVPEGIPLDRVSLVLTDSERVSYRFFKGASNEVLARNSLGLIKSGTSTLEAAVLGCVPVIFYRVSLITRLIFQYLIGYSGAVGLPNILLGVKKREDSIFPERLGPDASPKALSQTLYDLIQNQALLKDKQKQGMELRSMLAPHTDIPVRVAKRLKQMIDHPVPKAILRKNRILFTFVSFIWSSVNFLRRNIYALGLLKSQTLSLPSILVGNLQAGGTGKTPVVIEIAKAAIARGFRVGIISRGYGRKLKTEGLIVSATHRPELRDQADQIGDEPAEILDALPGVQLGLGKDRVTLAKKLENHGVNFLIFDDGFQNLKFKAKKTVLTVTDQRPGQCVYRDFLDASKVADLVLQTKGLPVPAAIEAKALKWTVDALPQTPIWLLCGVGDPDEVAQFYRNLGVRIERIFRMPDHAEFDLDEIKRLSEEALMKQATLAVTQKDWVKLKSAKNLTLFVLRRKINSEDWLESLFKS